MVKDICNEQKNERTEKQTTVRIRDYDKLRKRRGATTEHDASRSAKASETADWERSRASGHERSRMRTDFYYRATQVYIHGVHLGTQVHAARSYLQVPSVPVILNLRNPFLYIF